MQKPFIFIKKCSEKNSIVSYFSKSLSCMTNRRQWILISASAFKLLQYVLLVEISKFLFIFDEKPALYSYVVEKGECYEHFQIVVDSLL